MCWWCRIGSYVCRSWTLLIQCNPGNLLTSMRIRRVFSMLNHCADHLYSILLVQLAFTCLVYPALILAYMGQAAYLSKHHDFYSSSQVGFYIAVPGMLCHWLMYFHDWLYCYFKPKKSRLHISVSYQIGRTLVNLIDNFKLFRLNLLCILNSISHFVGSWVVSLEVYRNSSYIYRHHLVNAAS